MPTYQYRCTDCADELEVVQKFTDDPLTQCPSCEGSLRKVFSAVGVVFKGTGFYATDNRSKGKAEAAKPASSDAAPSGGSSSTPAALPASASKKQITPSTSAPASST